MALPIARPGIAPSLIVSRCHPPQSESDASELAGPASCPCYAPPAAAAFITNTLFPSHCHLVTGFLACSPFLFQVLQVNCYLKLIYIFTFLNFG